MALLLLGSTSVAFPTTPAHQRSAATTASTTTAARRSATRSVVRPMPQLLHASIASTMAAANDSKDNQKGRNVANMESIMTTTSTRLNASSQQQQTPSSSSTTTTNQNPPPLKRHAARKICLMVEPTPFTHVSGYANRFKEMLKFMRKAGDDVHILTVDSKTAAAQLPKEYMGYPIEHTQGFTFPLYNHISLTIDLPEMKGGHILEQMKPDIIHVTSPGFLLFAAMFYARVMKIPLVMSYHTHLPSYGKLKSFRLYGSPFVDGPGDALTHNIHIFIFVFVCVRTRQARIIWDSYPGWKRPAGIYCVTHTVGPI